MSRLSPYASKRMFTRSSPPPVMFAMVMTPWVSVVFDETMSLLMLAEGRFCVAGWRCAWFVFLICVSAFGFRQGRWCSERHPCSQDRLRSSQDCNAFSLLLWQPWRSWRSCRAVGGRSFPPVFCWMFCGLSLSWLYSTQHRNPCKGYFNLFISGRWLRRETIHLIKGKLQIRIVSIGFVQCYF